MRRIAEHQIGAAAASVRTLAAAAPHERSTDCCPGSSPCWVAT